MSASDHRIGFHYLTSTLIFLCLIAACVRLPATPAPSDDMVRVPAGWFLMGQDDGPLSNRPQRSVYLDAYRIDRAEVTQADFAAFVAQTNFQPEQAWDDEIWKDRASEPAVGILWAEADAYCRWAGKRLPSEAEWEKAARGTDGRAYPWGNVWDAARVNTVEGGRGSPLPVSSFAEGASPYGALDMAGNAAEWVADYFAFDYYTDAPDRNPPGPGEVLDHGLRGGSWASSKEQAQTFYRDSSHSAKPNGRVGFRCAQTAQKDDRDEE